MSKNRLGLLGAAALVPLLSGCAVLGARGPASIGGDLFFVKNNSSASLSCRTRGDSGQWDSPMALAPVDQWQESAASRFMYLSCSPPAEQVVYRLKPGRRYSLLRQPPGGPVVKLIEISAD